MKYSSDCRYTKDHEWIRPGDDGTAVVGITHFAQEELGDVVFVELPQVGQSFEANAEIGSIESVKAVAEIYSPASGEIVEVNEKVGDAPELVNEDPHGEGWLIRLRLNEPSQLEELMSAEQYEGMITQ